MIVFKKALLLHDFLGQKRKEKITIGFVPTMGALHDGHISLIEKSLDDNHLTICSIYVNPTQFNDARDLEKYPRNVTGDIEILCTANCDVVFMPSTEEIYPAGMGKLKEYDLGHLEKILEGTSRPGHFQGVANVVARFLEIIRPDRLYLGQKDFQQVRVLEQIAGRWETEIVVCPTRREATGLAMSSRNKRLNGVQRKNAAGIAKSLLFLQEHWREKDLPSMKQHTIYRINSIPEAQVDYLEFCDAVSFKIIHDWNSASKIVCVTAVRLGDVRLLDNVLLN